MHKTDDHGILIPLVQLRLLFDHGLPIYIIFILTKYNYQKEFCICAIHTFTPTLHKFTNSYAYIN